MKVEPPDTHLQTPLRRTSRRSVPSSDLMLRRQIIRENFLKTSESAKKQQKTAQSTNGKKKQAIDTRKLDRKVKTRNKIVNDAKLEQKPVLDACDISPKTEVKVERNDEMPDSFIVTKAVRITSQSDRDIHPTYFPSEDENSGVIVFKSNSRRAVLKISYAKCFVVLSGKFSIDEQGEFSNGDFIKAPAGSKLGIKYLGGSGGCGKIIFFKSVN